MVFAELCVPGGHIDVAEFLGVQVAEIVFGERVEAAQRDCAVVEDADLAERASAALVEILDSQL